MTESATGRYRTAPSLFGDVEEKAGNEDIAQAFRKRLKEVAGFKYVPDPIPMRHSRGATVYYLYFASPSDTEATIVGDIFDACRSRGTV